MWPLYYAGMYLLVLGIRFSALWNPKSKQWAQGRKRWRSNLKTLGTKSSTRIWFHVSSLGEFEQARPVIEKIKKEKPEIEIILSFFSPSGYTMKLYYTHARVVYLPPDLPGNADLWIQYVKPDLAVFVKYDLWPGYLKSLLKYKIPTILISANWTPNNIMSSWSFPLTQSLLKRINKIFLQRGSHLDYFLKKGFRNIDVGGDTRIDRSIALPLEVAEQIPRNIIEAAPFDLVAGSTWPHDEELIIHAIQTLSLRAIIAPHDITSINIQRLKKRLPVPYQLLSQLKQNAFYSQVLVVDSIGLLSVLYSAGAIAYVGGGFGKSIHNTCV